MTTHPAALSGMTVIDCSQVMAGPFCTMLLADLGADVIKVEPPSGDSTRQMPGPGGGESPSYWALNRNKRGMVINLKHQAGVEIVRTLAATADVFVENFRPGVMDSLGLGYPVLAAQHRGLIYASISGFGQHGPYAARGGFDLVAQGMSGIMSVTGDAGLPPMKCGLPITDLGAGLFATYAILAAYAYRQRTGEGQHIDTSLLEAGIALSVWEAAEYWSGRGIPQPMGSAHRMSGPYQAIRCADGYITLGAASQRTWERLCQALGRAELITRPEFATDGDRVRHRRELVPLIEEITRAKPMQHWLDMLEDAGVPCGPILNYAQVFDDPHVRHRGMVQQLDHPVGGRINQLGPPVKLSATPARLRRPAPTFGQHTAEILAELGYDGATVNRLAAEGAVVLRHSE
ncbi:MAG: CoA transferase [Bacillati bacterium ANGP1]|uniref:CoA transferase n=1 Tax=Candidatus Segetimicrobium genomatis TaxID=2569760 RepID=A0A537LP28_9BACT|nr:MAG: CoA transferase [Terrabacteria group bacterium ANGP1]